MRRSTGEVLASLAGSDTGGRLTAHTASGVNAAVLRCDAEGRGRVETLDGTTIRTSMGVTESGDAVISVSDATGTKAALAATSHGGLLNIMSLRGIPILVAGGNADAPGGAIAIINARGVPVITLQVDATDGGKIVTTTADAKRSKTLEPVRSSW